jgi:hypothetical protein
MFLVLKKQQMHSRCVEWSRRPTFGALQCLLDLWRLTPQFTVRSRASEFGMAFALDSRATRAHTNRFTPQDHCRAIGALKKPGEPRAERPQVLKKVRRASLRSEVFRRLCATKEYRTWCTTSRAVHFHQKTAQSNKRGAENERKCASISLNTSLSMIGKRWTLFYELHGLQEQTPHFDEVVVVTVERNSNQIEACRHIELAVLMSYKE